MKQFSILTLFGVMTLAAIACGIVHWLGPLALVFVAPICLLGAPLTGSIIGIRSQDVSKMPWIAMRFGAYGSAAGFIALNLILAQDFIESPSPLSLAELRAWVFTLLALMAFGGFVGYLTSAIWYLLVCFRTFIWPIDAPTWELRFKEEQ